MVLDTVKNRLRDRADIELVVTAKPYIPLHNSPPNACGQEFRADLIIGRRIKRAEQISRLHCQLKSLRIEYLRRYCSAWRFSAAERLRADQNNRTNSKDARFHSARLR
jgi:hypothetical protein